MMFPLLAGDFELCGSKRQSSPIACYHLDVPPGSSQRLLICSGDIQVLYIQVYVRTMQVPFLNLVSKL